MNWIDLAITIIAGLSLIRGYRSGFIKQITSVLALVVAGFFCSKVALLLSPLIVRYFDVSAQVLKVASLSLSFVIIVWAIRFFSRKVERIISFSIIKTLNRFLGAILSPLVSLSLLSVLFLTIDTIFPPITHTNKQQPEDIRVVSKFYMPVKHIVSSTIFATDGNLSFNLLPKSTQSTLKSNPIKFPLNYNVQ